MDNVLNNCHQMNVNHDDNIKGSDGTLVSSQCTDEGHETQQEVCQVLI